MMRLMNQMKIYMKITHSSYKKQENYPIKMSVIKDNSIKPKEDKEKNDRRNCQY